VRRREEARGVVAATAITVFLGGLAAFFLVATFLTKPVRTLSRLATRIARGDEGAVRDLETGLAGEAGAVAAALEGVVGKLEAQRAMLQSQSEATDEGILTVDPAGRLITHNRRLRELFGLSREELGASWAALRPRLEAALAAPLPGWLAAPAPALPEGERASFDVATRDGRTLSVHASTVRTASGAALGLGLYLRDLTGRVRDRRRIEELAESLERRVEARTREVEAKNAELARSLEELRRTQEQLVVADRRISLGRLAAGVAHEVNNPLAYLLANVRWVADGLGEIAARDAAAPGAGRPAGDDAPPALEEMRRALADAAEGAVRD
jgi:PAS domain S-box-containing protein